MNAKLSKVKSFTDLLVYQRAYAASLRTHEICNVLPVHEKRDLDHQMRRASRSICANIAEGFGKQRGSAAEYKRFLLIAIGSSDEMKVWLQYCEDLSYVEEKISKLLIQEYSEIARMLQGIYSKW